MAKSVDDRGRGARLARRDEGAYCWYVTEEQQSQPGCLGREGDRLSYSRALSSTAMSSRAYAATMLACGVVGLMGCAGRFDPAHFEGASEPRRAEPEAIQELAAGTNALESLGSVHDSCTLKPGFRRLQDEPLSDLDCSTERLRWALRESAANAGGEVLVGVRCGSRRSGTSASERYFVTCAGTVARFVSGMQASPGPLTAPRSLPQGTPAPSASDVQRIDQPEASLAFRIALRFEPLVAKFERRARSSAEVQELALLPIADHPLGDLAASCEGGCDERALRYGVLVAAGRMGVPDVVGVRCFSTGSGNACVGTLAAPERDE
jgi:hypothetical protein